MRPDPVVIEVIFAGGNVPRECYFQTRAVGGRYYAHVEKGSYGGSVDIRVDELVSKEINKRKFELLSPIGLEIKTSPHSLYISDLQQGPSKKGSPCTR